MASAPVLATKLFAPARRAQLVARPRLGDRLGATLGDCHAHLDQGPAGAGLAWLSLDDGDNDVTRLLTHLVAALRRAGLDVDGAPLESQPAAVLTALVNDISGAGRRVVLVLDDYHVI